MIGLADLADSVDNAIDGFQLGKSFFERIAVARVIPGVRVSINQKAAPDNRSYKVNFDLYKRLAPDHQPQVDLFTSIKELEQAMKGDDKEAIEAKTKALTDAIRARLEIKSEPGVGTSADIIFPKERIFRR